MRSGTRLSLFVLVSVVVLFLAATSFAQQIRFTDFSSLTNVQINGSAHQAVWQEKYVLRLTDGPLSPLVTHPETSTAYFTVKQPVTSGFTTWFEFQTHNPTSCCTYGDGIAFILQNSTATDSSYGASGVGLTALGAGNGGMGYAGINNNLAVEFDIFNNAWDPNSNHVAIQSCGANTNTPVHLPGDYRIGNNNMVTSCLLSSNAINTTIPMMGGMCNGRSCSDGPVHQVVIDYEPPAPNQSLGTLSVWLDPVFIPHTHTPEPNSPPIISVPYNITSLMLDNNTAWAGFTASQPGLATAQDVMAWEFTPHTPIGIQQVIPPGGVPNNFVFGGHEMVVTYPPGFMNPQGILMTVLATPTDRNTFFRNRLLGTPFSNESCIVYLETGGNCVVYSVTCQDPITMLNVPCPSEMQPTIDIDTGYTTADPVSATNADFLKATIGLNNWISIFTSWNQNGFDPVTSGKGNSFSDIVATFVRNKQ
jgi:hypothetical protein